MIRPLDIISREMYHLPLKFQTDPGLGRGGFSCNLWKDILLPGGREGYFRVEGKHVHPVGPFKNWVECTIKLTVSPTWGDNGSNNDGYSYRCEYKSHFRGMYYTDDFEKLVHSLLDRLCEHFEYHDEVYRKESDDEKIRLVLYKNQRAGSFYL